MTKSIEDIYYCDKFTLAVELPECRSKVFSTSHMKIYSPFDLAFEVTPIFTYNDNDKAMLVYKKAKDSPNGSIAVWFERIIMFKSFCAYNYENRKYVKIYEKKDDKWYLVKEALHTEN